MNYLSIKGQYHLINNGPKEKKEEKKGFSLETFIFVERKINNKEQL